MKHDYNLTELKQIKVRDMAFNIMPRYLYHYTDKEYEEFSLDILDRLVKKGGTAIDIGAHYGIYSLLAAKKAKKVYAFEPVPENYEILKKNIHDNELDTVIEPFNQAVSDEEGVVEFNITWASDSAGFYEHPNAEVIRKIKVQTNFIDNQLSHLKDISFIKIDTEGHEIHVLDGMKKTLKNNQATMLIEFNPECLENAGSSTRQLIDKIISLEYDIFALHEETRHIVRVTKEVSDEQILQGRTYLNFLCLPKGSWDNPLFFSHSSEIGGAELVLHETVEGLLQKADRFILPTIILPGRGPLINKFEHLGVGLVVVPFDGWVRNSVRTAEDILRLDEANGNAIMRLTAVMDDVKPSVVVTNTVAAPWAALAAGALGIPHVWSIHEYGDLDHGFTFDYEFDESLKIIDTLSARVLVNSEAVKAHIKKYISGGKLYHVPLAVQTPILSSKKIPSVFSDDAKIKLVLASSNISVSKGQMEAVKAIQELREKHIEAELLLIGNDKTDHAKELKAYVKKHDLTKAIHFVGFVPNPADYIAMADIFVMASRSEAFGRVTVEAMLLGKPVVGANSGGTAEIVNDGKTGYLYKPGSSHDLAEAILKLTRQDSARKLGKSAKEFAQSHHQGDYVTQIYEQMQLAIAQYSPITHSQLVKVSLLSVLRAFEKKDKEIARLEQQYKHDIKLYSDDYNKVYAAYNELEKRLEKFEKHPAIKVLRKVNRVKDILRKK